MKRFGYGIIAGFLVIILGISASFVAVAVFFPNRAPAPSITKLALLDEKLRFLRQHPEFDPMVLAVGSSITWRQLSGPVLDRLAGGPHRFLNGAIGFLQIHETRALAQFYLAHYRHVRTILVLTSVPDFEDCTNKPREMFDPTDAARYVYHGWPSVYFQLRYFSPGHYLKTLLTLPQRKTQFTGDLYIDAYGSGPVELPKGTDLGLRFGKSKFDPACVDSLVGMAQDMEARNIRMVVVFTPVHPEYRARFPREIEKMEAVIGRLRQVKSQIPNGLTVIDMMRSAAFKKDDFYDAFHMEWPSAKRLSAHIVERLEGHRPVEDEQGFLTRANLER